MNKNETQKIINELSFINLNNCSKNNLIKLINIYEHLSDINIVKYLHKNVNTKNINFCENSLEFFNKTSCLIKKLNMKFSEKSYISCETENGIIIYHYNKKIMIYFEKTYSIDFLIKYIEKNNYEFITIKIDKKSYIFNFKKNQNAFVKKLENISNKFSNSNINLQIYIN